MAPERQPFIRNPMSANAIYNWQNPIYLDEIRIIVLMLRTISTRRALRCSRYLQILSWNLDLVEFLKLKVAEPGTECFQVHPLRSLIQHSFEMISPFTQIANVRFQR